MDENNLAPDDLQQQTPEEEAASPTIYTPVPQEAEDDLPPEEDDPGSFSAQFVVPFQPSGPQPALNGQVEQMGSNGRGTGARGRKARRRIPLLRVVLITAVLVLGGGFFAFTVLAQPASHLTTGVQNPARGSGATPTAPTARPSPIAAHATASPATTATGTQTSTASTWVPSTQTLQQLGWTAAGLSMGDALEAERTAWTFNDREMSLDYRNAGTRGQHSGTFTAALFLLTPNARARFFANDVREINNALFDRVQQQQLIQEVVSDQPRLVLYQVQNRQQFAWVDVSFQLWQARIDPQNGSQVEGLELDPATNGSRVHHMIVLLLRVDIAGQGTNAPMGGTGWLVSTYALDPAGGNLPAVIQPA